MYINLRNGNYVFLCRTLFNKRNAMFQVYWLPAPVFIMGVVATFAGVLAVLFPETLGEKLPETLDDAIRYALQYLFYFLLRHLESETP